MLQLAKSAAAGKTALGLGATIRACVHSGGAVYVAHGGSGDAVLGVAICGSPQKPKHSALTLLRSGLWAAPVRLGIPAWRRRRALAPVLAALKPPGPCWYLNGIGVDPSAQRTGLGSALINQMLPRIDDDALPAFLDTSAPDNLGYYEQFGFNGDGGVDAAERYLPLGHDAAAVSGSGRMRPRARRSASCTQ